MQEYSYKGFKIEYEIKENDPDSFQASARVVCYADNQNQIISQQFQTSSDSEVRAQKEIKRLVKNYIDFEWKEFLKMQGEHHKDAFYDPRESGR